jgi:hypothetical protein
VLLCGYTDDGADTTLATASLMLHIKPAQARCARLRSRRARARCRHAAR